MEKSPEPIEYDGGPLGKVEVSPNVSAWIRGSGRNCDGLNLRELEGICLHRLIVKTEYSQYLYDQIEADTTYCSPLYYESDKGVFREFYELTSEEQVRFAQEFPELVNPSTTPSRV